MNQTVVIWAGIKAVGLYYLIQGVLGLLSGFVLAVGEARLADIGAVVWWSNIVSAAIGAYLVLDGAVVFRAAAESVRTERQTEA